MNPQTDPAAQTAKTQDANAAGVRQRKKSPAASTQRFLSVAAIRDDVMVLKNGGMRAVLSVCAVNVGLKSETEQNALIMAYQNFLNALEFPVQILVRSKKLDLDDYLRQMKSLPARQQNPLLRRQTEDYLHYMSRLVEYADIMKKEFYVVVPMTPIRARDLNVFQKFMRFLSPDDTPAAIRTRNAEFSRLRRDVMHRANIAKAGLEGCGLQVEMLDSSGLVRLMYEMYHPETSRHQKISDMGRLDVLDA